MALWIALPWLLWVLISIMLREGHFGLDSHAYWSAWRRGLYTEPPGAYDAYLYSPVFAEVIWPLTLLPWPVFSWVWLGLMLVASAWLAWPLTLKWRWLVFALGIPFLMAGNIEVLLAASAVVALRAPAAWAFPLLTKITPGIGVLWFGVRREWWSFSCALMATLTVAGISYAIAPNLWAGWWTFLTTAQPSSDVLNAPAALGLSKDILALALLTWGSLTGRRWAIPVAMVLASAMSSVSTLLILLAIPRLMDRRPSLRSSPNGTVVRVEATSTG